MSNKDNVLGADPCESDDVFPDNMKYCLDGTMYVLQKWNNWEGESARPLDGVYFDIPGWGVSSLSIHDELYSSY